MVTSFDIVDLLLCELFFASIGAATGVEVPESAADQVIDRYVIPPANLATAPYPEWAHHHW